MLSDDARRIETKLASALGVEPGAVRRYVTELLDEPHSRGRLTTERRTGFRMVRGSHGCSYVRDPNGVDPLPPGVEPPAASSRVA